MSALYSFSKTKSESSAVKSGISSQSWQEDIPKEKDTMAKAINVFCMPANMIDIFFMINLYLEC